MEEKSNYNYGVSLSSIGKSIDVSAPNDTGATGWRYDSGSSTITIFEPNDYTLTGTTTSNKVIIQPDNKTNEPFNIVIQDLNINKSGEANSSAISIKGEAFCRLLVYRSNHLLSGENAAAINVSSDSSLEIDELIPERGGYLDIDGGKYASCIGANVKESYGNITIKNINLDLTLPCFGSGIGYGDITQEIEGTSGEIKILSGYISASLPVDVNSEYMSNGICCNTLEISGGWEYFYVDEASGSGIAFAGRSSDENKITINGDTNIWLYGGKNYPGINCYTDNGIGKLIIDGGNITAYGGQEAAGIGIGNYNINIHNTNQSIIINNGNITAYGGQDAAGIGSGSGLDFGTIEINGGLVSAYGNSGAGIGAGKYGTVENIKISSSASVIAESNNSNIYDIGDGFGNDAGYSSYYSGIYSGMYRGEISGVYQGKLSGLFKGKIFREYTKRIKSNVSGFYTGKAEGIYSGLFYGKFLGYTNEFYQ